MHCRNSHGLGVRRERQQACRRNRLQVLYSGKPSAPPGLSPGRSSESHNGRGRTIKSWSFRQDQLQLGREGSEASGWVRPGNSGREGTKASLPSPCGACFLVCLPCSGPSLMALATTLALSPLWLSTPKDSSLISYPSPLYSWAPQGMERALSCSIPLSVLWG